MSSGHSMIVTDSHVSFLCIFEPGLSTSRTMCVMPALKPMNAVRCGGLLASSFGNDLTLPRLRFERFFGKKPRLP